MLSIIFHKFAQYPWTWFLEFEVYSEFAWKSFPGEYMLPLVLDGLKSDRYHWHGILWNYLHAFSYHYHAVLHCWVIAVLMLSIIFHKFAQYPWTWFLEFEVYSEFAWKSFPGEYMLPLVLDGLKSDRYHWHGILWNYLHALPYFSHQLSSLHLHLAIYDTTKSCFLLLLSYIRDQINILGLVANIRK